MNPPENTLGTTRRATPVPPFVPHPLLRNGHAQTIIGRYLPGPRLPLRSTYSEVALGDGDALTVLESMPGSWRRGGPCVLLVHGLAGCANSPYVVRVAYRLWNLGIRVVRMNLRGAGSGFGLARGTYHAGKSDDVRRVVEWLSRRAPGSPVALVGFSLGANIALKLAAEAAVEPLDELACVIAANPPLDLAESCQQIQSRENRIYDKNFVRSLRADVARLHDAFPDLGPVDLPNPMTILDFDDRYTALRNGFAGAMDYYAKSSAVGRIPEIRVPGLVVHAEDDPFIPTAPFRRARFPESLALEMIPGGGHLGYISDRPWLGDRRWLDARITSWLKDFWSLE